jgi:SAM-dependent methyltransferase
MTPSSSVLDKPRALVKAEEPLRLLIGGRTTKLDGFLNVDLYEGPEVDVRTDASDLSMFETRSVSEIYSSHILEHFPHTKTVDVLKEWRRVLKNDGKAHISVPDFDSCIKLYLSYGMTDFIRNLLYGDQQYTLAFHYTAFTFATLALACTQAGFSDVKRISQMPYGLLDCSSNVDTANCKPISVSVEALA